MTFYDYNFTVTPEGREFYRLCADMISLRGPRYCIIRRQDAGHGGWERITQWGSKAGRRYQFFGDDLDKALASGIAWARRRERQDELSR